MGYFFFLLLLRTTKGEFALHIRVFSNRKKKFIFTKMKKNNQTFQISVAS